MSDQLKISRLMDVWSVGAIGAELALMRPLFENVYTEMYDRANNDDSPFLKWLGDGRTSVIEHNESIPDMDKDLRSLVFDCLLVKDVRKRASLPVALKHPFFSTNQPIKLTWSIPSLPLGVHKSNNDQRLFNLNVSEISFDLSNPLESDDANALLHDSSADDEDRKPGLSPLEVTPMISPNGGITRRSLLSYLCCRLEKDSS
jgi:serine/threonine protein kinase